MCMNTVYGMPPIWIETLFSLPNEDKIDLAKKLLESISIKRKETDAKISPFSSISDAWEDGRSMEDVVGDMRSHRTFSRNIKDW